MAIAFDANLGTVTNAGTLTTSAAAAAGSRVFMCVGWFADGGETLTGGSGGGLTWVVDQQHEWSQQSVGIVTADAPAGLASTTNISPTFSSAASFRGLGAFSFTGMGTGASGYVDATSTETNNFDEDWATTNVVTTMADTLVLGISFTASCTTHAADATYTEVLDFNTEGASDLAVVYRIVSSAATYNPGGVWGGTADYNLNFGIAYEAGVAVGPSPALVAAREFNGGRFGPF